MAECNPMLVDGDEVVECLEVDRESANMQSQCANDTTDSLATEKCSICLGEPLVNPTSLDNCIHRFCLCCISEWLKLRAVCPMCKKIVSIVSSFNKKGEIEIITIKDIQRRALLERIVEEGQRRSMSVERQQLIHRIRQLQDKLRDFENVVHSSMDPNRRSRNVELINRYRLLLDNFNRPRADIVGDPTFRMLVYDLKLRRFPISRDAALATCISISPAYFSEVQEAEWPRISEFLIRDLQIILSGRVNISEDSRLVFELMKNHHIMSPDFSNILVGQHPLIRNNVEHFCALLFGFASSGQHLHIYDQNSEYLLRHQISHRFFSNASADDDIRVDRVIRRDRQGPSVAMEDNNSGDSHRVQETTLAGSQALAHLQRFLFLLNGIGHNPRRFEGRELTEIMQNMNRCFTLFRYQLRNMESMNRSNLNVPPSSEIVLDDSDGEDVQVVQMLPNAAGMATRHRRRHLNLNLAHQRIRTDRLERIQRVAAFFANQDNSLLSHNSNPNRAVNSDYPSSMMPAETLAASHLLLYDFPNEAATTANQNVQMADHVTLEHRGNQGSAIHAENGDLLSANSITLQNALDTVVSLDDSEQQDIILD